RLGANVVEFFANAVISGVNGIIAAINAVIEASNFFLHTNFETIDSIDKISIASEDAATSVGTVAPALDAAASSSGRLHDALAAGRPLLDAMGTSYKDLAAGAQEAFDKA